MVFRSLMVWSMVGRGGMRWFVYFLVFFLGLV